MSGADGTCFTEPVGKINNIRNILAGRQRGGGAFSFDFSFNIKCCFCLLLNEKCNYWV